MVTQYTQLVDEAIYNNEFNVSDFVGDERIELINALLDQFDYSTTSREKIMELVESLAPVHAN